MRNGIDYKDISVVIQGAVSTNTKKTIDSIREYLPGAIVILSTWAGSNTEGLGYDQDKLPRSAVPDTGYGRSRSPEDGQNKTVL